MHGFSDKRRLLSSPRSPTTRLILALALGVLFSVAALLVSPAAATPTPRDAPAIRLSGTDFLHLASSDLDMTAAAAAAAASVAASAAASTAQRHTLASTLRRAADVRCIGHRGVAALYPENTLPSLQAALDSGADGLELDIRLTADDVVVVMHDPELDRTTTGKGSVRNHTWAELQQLRGVKTHLGFTECFGLDAGDPALHPGAGPATAPIPKLADVFDLLLAYPRPVTCIIDIKWDNPLSIMTHLRSVLAVPAYAPLLPRITLGIWSPHFIPALPPRSVPVVRSFIGANLTLARMCSRAVDNFSLDLDVILANQDWVAARRARGYSISAWTVDRPADLRTIMATGLVDGVISDCVAQCVAVRDEARRELVVEMDKLKL
ncbi:hypothetical protein H9P43_003907 [Blastocladiella emersonii ATCC 22665]|nr:hypothetical protein H9P43_003907 [Blastocladiella emersonii ATCC 22665]